MGLPKGYGAGGLWRNLGGAILAIFLVLPGAVAAETLKIIAFGDSLTQGYGLPVDDGLVPQLQAWLRDRGHDVELINAGVSGDTTAGGRARIDWALASGGDALIVALGGNDMLRGLDPAEARANLDAILTSAEPMPTLLVGLSAPGNYGPDYKAAFDALYPELAAAHGTGLFPDLLAPITADTDMQTALATLMQADGVHPNAAGVSLIVAALGPKVEELLAGIGG